MSQQRLPFYSFCAEAFGSTGAVTAWAARIGCPEESLSAWCAGVGAPDARQLVHIHAAVMSAPDVSPAQRERWLAVIALPVRQALKVPSYLAIDGEPAGADHLATLGDCMTEELLRALNDSLRAYPLAERLEFLLSGTALIDAVGKFGHAFAHDEATPSDGAPDAAPKKKPLPVIPKK